MELNLLKNGNEIFTSILYNHQNLLNEGFGYIQILEEDNTLNTIVLDSETFINQYLENEEYELVDFFFTKRMVIPIIRKIQ